MLATPTEMIRITVESSSKDVGIVDDIDNSKPLITAGSVFVENFRQAIDFNAVVKATIKDTNKLSSGTFSSVYNATMPSGLVVLVRSLIGGLDHNPPPDEDDKGA